VIKLGFKRNLLLSIKNLPGWRTKRKIVVFSVDDYGNVRMASKHARENLIKKGLNLHSNRFDLYDCLEDNNDLTYLFEVLNSFKDKNNNSAVFTCFTNPANIDFEKMAQTGYSEYHYELLPDTFKKLNGYENVFTLWKEGIKNKLIMPQFHGREHVNIKLLLELLKNNNSEVLTCFENRSFPVISKKQYKTISLAASFSFDKFEENETHKKTISDGLKVFEKVFGFKALNFNAPGIHEHHSLENTLRQGGVMYIDTDIIKNEHQGNGVYRRQYNYLGKKSNSGLTYLIRNCVFEPSIESNIDWVDTCLTQIEISFKLNKPANISSHRINFSGHIEPENREHGLKQLKKLLKAIVVKWPDVEFMTSDELGNLITSLK